MTSRRAFLMAAALPTGVLLCGGALLSGCNTVEGAGRDIEKAGDAIQDQAKKEKRRH